ncbi:MAG TPA: Gfo/Idh/MocA family oxidoreductase [Motilibacterales bacterium]|nr:Gfo/Idh/MocA family oxidoreductase [Motilibacterales bacterium]
MSGRRLRVGLIGLGDIAAKAYLPVLAADGEVEPVLITRDPARLDALQSAWRIAEGHASVEDALAAGVTLDAAFVHAATAAHPSIALALIAAGVPAFIDKPLALSAVEAQHVVERARAAGVSLAVCFNRRLTPAYAEVAAWPGLDTVVLTKNRIGLPDDPRVVVFDDFVHVVDTLRFLVAPDPEDVQVVARHGADGNLARVAVTLRQGGRLAVGIMDRDSGQTIEILDAMAPGRARRVTDLVDVVDRVGGLAQHRQPDNWASVAHQRGFTAMVGALLESVRAHEVLDGGDALATHALCEEILAEVQRQAP